MPTTKRISVTGAIAHIISRGIEGRDILIDDADRHYLLELLSLSIIKTGYRGRPFDKKD